MQRRRPKLLQSTYVTKKREKNHKKQRKNHFVIVCVVPYFETGLLLMFVTGQNLYCRKNSQEATDKVFRQAAEEREQNWVTHNSRKTHKTQL